jgi:hypothetical protein
MSGNAHPADKKNNKESVSEFLSVFDSWEKAAAPLSAATKNAHRDWERFASAVLQHNKSVAGATEEASRRIADLNLTAAAKLVDASSPCDFLAANAAYARDCAEVATRAAQIHGQLVRDAIGLFIRTTSDSPAAR